MEEGNRRALRTCPVGIVWNWLCIDGDQFNGLISIRSVVHHRIVCVYLVAFPVDEGRRPIQAKQCLQKFRVSDLMSINASCQSYGIIAYLSISFNQFPEPFLQFQPFRAEKREVSDLEVALPVPGRCLILTYLDKLLSDGNGGVPTELNLIHGCVDRAMGDESSLAGGSTLTLSIPPQKQGLQHGLSQYLIVNSFRVF